MPFLPSSGAISINDIKNLFGGPASPALSNYYRGGSYIPSSKTVTVREPASGQYYSDFLGAGNTYFWSETSFQIRIYWNSPKSPGTPIASISGGVTSYSTGGYTYYRGTYVLSDKGVDAYGIYRTSSSTASINTGIPASGTISLSQFYGAEKP